MIRRLTSNQTFDPGRGSFIVRARARDTARNIFVAPTEQKRDGTYNTFSNSIEFIPESQETRP